MDYAQRVQQLTQKLGVGAPDYSQKWQAPVAHVMGPGGMTKPDYGGQGMDYFQQYKSGGDYKPQGSVPHVHEERELRPLTSQGRQLLALSEERKAAFKASPEYKVAQARKEGVKFVETSPGVHVIPSKAYAPAPSVAPPVSPAVVLPPVSSPTPPIPVQGWPMLSKAIIPVKEYDNGTTMYQNRVNGSLYWLGPEGQHVEYQPRHDRMFIDGEQTTSFPSWFPPEEKSMVKSQGLR